MSVPSTLSAHPYFRTLDAEIVPGSRSKMHLAAHDRRRLDPRPVGQRPRRLFHHVRAASRRLQHRAPGPDLQRHERRFDLRRDGGDRRGAARREHLRHRQFGGGEDAGACVRRDDVHPSPVERSRRSDADRAATRHVPQGQRARRAQRALARPRRASAACAPRPRGSAAGDHRHAAKPVRARRPYQHAPGRRYRARSTPWSAAA